MAPTSRPLRKLGFLTLGLFDAADPRRGHDPSRSAPAASNWAPR